MSDVNLTVYFIMLLMTYSLQTLGAQQLATPPGFTVVFNNTNDNKNNAHAQTYVEHTASEKLLRINDAIRMLVRSRI